MAVFCCVNAVLMTVMMIVLIWIVVAVLQGFILTFRFGGGEEVWANVFGKEFFVVGRIKP